MFGENQNRPIRYSIGLDKYDNIPSQYTAADFNEFEMQILSRRSNEKGKTYFCSALKRGEHKNREKYPLENTYRQKELVEPKRFHPLDFDGFRDAQTFAKCFELFESYRGFGYTTWSHQPDQPRARAVFELSREVTRSEGVLLGQAFQTWIEESLESGAVIFDDSVYRGEQPIYSPPANAQIFQFKGNQLIDVDTFLFRYRPSKSVAENKVENNAITYGRLKPGALTQVLSKLDNTQETIWTDVANVLARVYGEEGREFFLDFSVGTYSGVQYAKFDPHVVSARYDRALEELKLVKNGIGVKRLCYLAGVDPARMEFEATPLTEELEETQAAFFASLPGHQAYTKSKSTGIATTTAQQSGPLVFPIVNGKISQHRFLKI